MIFLHFAEICNIFWLKQLFRKLDFWKLLNVITLSNTEVGFCSNLRLIIKSVCNIDDLYMMLAFLVFLLFDFGTFYVSWECLINVICLHGVNSLFWKGYTEKHCQQILQTFQSNPSDIFYKEFKKLHIQKILYF